MEILQTYSVASTAWNCFLLFEYFSSIVLMKVLILIYTLIIRILVIYIWGLAEKLISWSRYSHGMWSNVIFFQHSFLVVHTFIPLVLQCFDPIGQKCLAQSAGAVEYTDWTSAEEWAPPPSDNECPEYDTKQSDGEVPVMLGLWGMRSTLSLPLLPGPLWPGMVALHRALSVG